VGIEAINPELWLHRREGDAEVEHLTACGIKLLVRREGTDLVQMLAKGEHTSRLKRHQVVFHR
jgi:hypothetical protein